MGVNPIVCKCINHVISLYNLVHHNDKTIKKRKYIFNYVTHNQLTVQS